MAPLPTRNSLPFFNKSLRAGLLLVAGILSTVFACEVGIMYVLPHVLPVGASQLFEAVLDSGMLSIVLAVVYLPLLMLYRKHTLGAAQQAVRMSFVVNQHALVSITDATGQITMANDRFCEISGYTQPELLGQNHRLINSGVHSAEFFKEMMGTLSTGKIWRGDMCNRKKSGELYWEHATITPFLNAHGKPEEFVAVRTEITAQKALENASQKHADQLRTILDNLGEGVYTLDGVGNLTYLNAEGERLLGWRFEELAGKSLHNIIHHHGANGEVLPEARCPIDLAVRGKTTYRSSGEIFYHKDGIPFPVTMTAAPLALHGDNIGSVAVFSDLREEQLLQQRLLDAKNAAEAATLVKTEFLSTMSHEIRTPLNGVIGMTDLLLDTPLDGEQTDFARTIKLSADALMSIINNILDFSKLEAAQILIERTDFSLRELIETCVDVLATKAHEKTLTLASFVAPDLPDQLIGDPTRLRQILLNFVSNAIKFTALGEVLVSVYGVSPSRADPHQMLVRIVVQDTGIGLNESAKQRLFQPFSQADSSTTRKYGGTGLGLSICKRLVEAMGGEIGVDSVPGVGSSFWAQIPLEVTVSNAPAILAESTLRGKRVLIAGDTAGFQAILGASLEAWQMDYEAVASVADLRARLAQQTNDGQAPDLLLLGYPLPDASLLEAVAALRLDGATAPVCCLPHQVDREMKSELLAHGAIVMHKPIKQSSLLDALMASLFRAQADSPAMTSLAVNRPRSSRHRLLLAEDNAVNQRVAVHILNKLGYGVDVVENGAMAVEAVVGGSYSLVLMDCQMPVMDGFAATRAIRQSEEKTGKHLPILAMTANAMQGDRELCLIAGMDDYITKPIHTARLAGTLASWLKDEIAVATPPAQVKPPLPAAGPAAHAIDLQRLTELVGDSPGAIDDMLLAFAKYLQPLQERLTTEVRNAGPDLKALLHELRGAASNLGANPLAQLASDLETGLADSNRVPVASQIARIDLEFKRVLDYLDRSSHRQLP